MPKWKNVNMTDGTIVTINLDNVTTVVRYGSSELTTIKFVSGETSQSKSDPLTSFPDAPARALRRAVPAGCAMIGQLWAITDQAGRARPSGRE